MKQPLKEPRAKSGMHRIRDERARQIAVEGWTAEHDDRHGPGDLFLAGHCYEAAGDAVAAQKPITPAVPSEWPWEPQWWKPSASAERNWEKAGALYQAEADRHARAGQQRKVMDMEMNLERVAAKLDKPQGTAPGNPKKPAGGTVIP